MGCQPHNQALHSDFTVRTLVVPVQLPPCLLYLGINANKRGEKVMALTHLSMAANIQSPKTLTLALALYLLVL